MKSVVWNICFALLAFFLFFTVLHAQDQNGVNPDSGKEYDTGLKLFSESKYSQALEQFKKAEQLDKNNTAAVFAQGLAFLKMNRPKEAVERFTAVLAKEPDHAKSIMALPVALYQAGEMEKALVAYDRAIANNPKTIDLYTGKAIIFLKMKKYDETIKTLEKAHQVDSKNIKIQETLAHTLAESGKTKEAAVIAKSILASSPNNARAHIIIGDNLRLSHKYAEALTHYQAAAKNLETKSYAEHFIAVIKKNQEEEDIEREYEQKQK